MLRNESGSKISFCWFPPLFGGDSKHMWLNHRGRRLEYPVVRGLEREVVPSLINFRKPCFLHHLISWPISATTINQESPETSKHQSLLQESKSPAFLSNNVLHVVELPPWLQHPLHLRQCLDLIVHCAENKGHDDGINGGVCHPRRNQVLSHSLLHILDIQLGELCSVLVEEGDKVGIWLNHLGIKQATQS